MPANIKAAVVQFLVVIVPNASSYFTVSHNCASFLSRLANVLGAGGSKPSVVYII